MKSTTVQSLTETFKLEVLAGASCMDREITRSKAHRPGLEFVGYFDFSQRSGYKYWAARKSIIC